MHLIRVQNIYIKVMRTEIKFKMSLSQIFLVLLISVAVMSAPVVSQLVSVDGVPDVGQSSDIGTPPPHIPPTAGDIVSFTKRLYSAMGRTTILKDIVDDFKGEYETLNYDGKLADKLGALYEMRVEDLQISIRHAKRMKDLVAAMDTPEGTFSKATEEVPKKADTLAASAKPTPQAAQSTLVSSLKP